MQLHVVHTTRHRYRGLARESQNEVRLRPLDDADQSCWSFSLTTSPSAPVREFDLPDGKVHAFGVHGPHAELTVVADAMINTHLDDPFIRMNLAVDDFASYDRRTLAENHEWLIPTARVPFDHPSVGSELDALADAARARADGPTVAHFLVALMHHIHQVFAYVPGATDVATPLAEVLAARHGVCQDTTHVLLAVCRRIGIPARYVSGYLFTGHGLTSGDRMHAWTECLLPDAYGNGWIWRGFDPTNDLVAGKSYIKVHRGRDYADIVPVKGVYSGAPTEELEVDVRVTEAVFEPVAALV